ncbi:MAG: hypothetical protein GY906_12945 [bacterium]|nr:hypothetical protein [bacterium]
MAQTAETFKRNLIQKMARRAAAIARPLIPSRTLRKALQIKYVRSGVQIFRAYLVIPHYWALYVHDGRGGFGPRRARVLVWFRDPRNDPRTDGATNYPVREGDIRRLTRSEFYHGVAMNHRHGTPDNPMPYMVIAKWRGGDKPQPFFSEGLANLNEVMTPLVTREFIKFIDTNLFSDADRADLRI